MIALVIFYFLPVNIDVIAQLCPKLSKVDVGLVMIKSDFFVLIEFGIDNIRARTFAAQKDAPSSYGNFSCKTDTG